MYFEAKHEYCEALCSNQISSGSDSTRLHDELDLQLVSIYKPQIFSYGTQPMVLFVGLAESSCLRICLKILLLLVINICYWLHPVVNPHMRRVVTELKSEKINWRVNVFLFCACVQIYEFQYYTLPVGYLIE